jgi:asparagine synthetase B (glutamine-hydrolysing)
MEYPKESEKRDLHLRFGRRKAQGWEELPSTSHFAVPLRVQKASNGTVYGQGVFLDQAGKDLSIQKVADLVDLYGPDAIHRLEGDFVIAVEDRRHGVWCATDRCAVFPLYYKLTDDELVITSRAENLTARSAADLDIECIVAALDSGYPWGDMTLLKDWKVLRPGHMVHIDKNDHAVVTGYFEPEEMEDVEGYKSPEELVESVDRSLKSIASRYGRILIPLSGGIDSRLVAVRSHALGIPFEAITFVANVAHGADFDIAARLVKVFGVKHYRWQWDASSEECVKNFVTLCHATGGTNDAYTSYPDGMSYFAQIASGFDCAIRGDHVFGMGPYSDSLVRSARHLSMRVTDNLDWALRPEFHNKVNFASIFEKQEGVSATATGDLANRWRHLSYRKSRSPRFILPIGQLQAQFVEIAYPFLSNEIVSRVSRTDTSLRDGKRIAREAVTACSPPEIRSIPFANESTWQRGEPLLNVSVDNLRKMIEIAEQPGILSDVVDTSGIIETYKAFLNGSRGPARKGLIRNVKKMIRDLLPAGVLARYDDKVMQTIRPAPYMMFKRFFAMKVYLDRISKGQN